MELKISDRIIYKLIIFNGNIRNIECIDSIKKLVKLGFIASFFISQLFLKSTHVPNSF